MLLIFCPVTCAHVIAHYTVISMFFFFPLSVFQPEPELRQTEKQLHGEFTVRSFAHTVFPLRGITPVLSCGN